MSRKLKSIKVLGLPPLRQYWREINRQERQAAADERARRKAQYKKRRKCRCEAYPWPHCPAGGLCRWPDPPLERWKPKPGSRPYRKRYAGTATWRSPGRGSPPTGPRPGGAVPWPRPARRGILALIAARTLWVLCGCGAYVRATIRLSLVPVMEGCTVCAGALKQAKLKEAQHL
jgi:hypothetical protein